MDGVDRGLALRLEFRPVAPFSLYMVSSGNVLMSRTSIPIAGGEGRAHRRNHLRDRQTGYDLGAAVRAASEWFRKDSNEDRTGQTLGRPILHISIPAGYSSFLYIHSMNGYTKRI